MKNALIVIFQILWGLLVFAIIAFIAYFFTKTFAKSSLNIRQSKNIKVVDSLSLGINKYLVIIKIGKKYYLFSVNDKTINFIKEIEEELEELYTSTEKNKMSSFIQWNKEKMEFSKEREFINKNMEKIKQLLNRSKKL